MAKDTKKGDGGDANTDLNNKGKGKDPNQKTELNTNKGDGDDQTIPKHRFDEVNNELKELRDWKTKQETDASKAKEEKLKQDKKWEELATKRGDDATKAIAQLSKEKMRNAVVNEAYKLGAIDAPDVYALIAKSKIKVDEDGNVTGAEEAVKALSEAKPHLFGEGKPASTMGAGSNPKTNQDKTYPISWVRDKWADVSWAKAKHEEHDGLTGEEFLNKLEAEGRIDYTP